MKFGRLPALHTPLTAAAMKVMLRHLAALGPPPANSDDYTTAVENVVGGISGWGDLGNNQYGCCVEADNGHSLMLRTANTGAIVIPSTADILGLYSAETGFDSSKTDASGNNPTDQGTDETSDCQYMVSTGLLGHKAAATGMVNPANLDLVRWCIQLFGYCKTGVNVQQAFMDQFNAGQSISYVPNSPFIGGHDFPLVRYYADGSFDGITWGKRINTEPSFFVPANGCFDEAHALIFPDFIEANGNAPNGFNLAQLLADLPQVTAGAQASP